MALTNDQAASQVTASAIDLAYQNWSFAASVSLEGGFDTQFWYLSMFGDSLMCDTLAWTRCLRWPPEVDTSGPMQFQTGVSWVELALSLMIQTGQYLPVLRDDAEGNKRLVHSTTFEEAKEIGLCATECGTILQKMWDNLRSVTPEPFLIPGKRMKVSSLYHLGSRYVQGWNIRYEFPKQKEVNELLREAITKGHCVTCWTPDLTQFLAVDRSKLRYHETYDKLLKTCSSGQYHVRKCRKERGL